MEPTPVVEPIPAGEPTPEAEPNLAVESALQIDPNPVVPILAHMTVTPFPIPTPAKSGIKTSLLVTRNALRKSIPCGKKGIVLMESIYSFVWVRGCDVT